ncbi:glycoside hydrolase family 9 protein [Natronospora cellulosivora (SeqCode)]
MIHINQLGYKPGDSKRVLVKNSQKKLKNFRIFDLNNEQVVYEGILKEAKYDPDSGEIVSKGDFSDLSLVGDYYIKLDNEKKSYNFSIKEGIYDQLKNDLLKLMYFQRCGLNLEEEYAGPWKHEACHLDDAYLYEEPDKKIDTSGGWHDAGDYGKYVVPAAKTIADLLLSYNFFPETFDENINIPESKKDMPDILHEAYWGLNWMFKMQNQDNGGVYHKVTTKQFVGMVMPETSKEKRYIMPISSTATACFAAVMAMASSIYNDFDQKLANEMVEAAEKAWQWLNNNPDADVFRNPEGVNTGGYGDEDDRDERYWAAVELYRSTGKDIYHNYIKDNINNDFDKVSIDWRNVGGYGTISYLSMEDGQDNLIYKKLKDLYFNNLNKMLARSEKSAYGLSIDEYMWGSNGLLMDQAMLLIFAKFLSEDNTNKYIQVARNNFDYLLACNVLDQCYVTGYGSKRLMNPHHRPSEADGVEEPVPGMVSGGPNSRLQDDALRDAVDKDVPPAKAFVDHLGSHSSNEITTYWNSPAVFVAAYFGSNR